VALRPTTPARGLLRGRLVFCVEGLGTLRCGFRLSRPVGGRVRGREIVLSRERPGQLIHDLPFVEATFDPGGAVRLEFDLQLDDSQALDRITLELVEEDSWRMHPGFDGGSSFALPPTEPTETRLQLRELALGPTDTVRKGPP
jgi:hypothetical protein